MLNQRKFSKELYGKEVLFKAVYALLDQAYFHLDSDSQYYFVSIIPKEEEDVEILFHKLEDNLIAEETRRMIAEKTKNIREMIVARALASTIVVDDSIAKEKEGIFDSEEILKDWFEENEE